MRKPMQDVHGIQLNRLLVTYTIFLYAAKKAGADAYREEEAEPLGLHDVAGGWPGECAPESVRTAQDEWGRSPGQALSHHDSSEDLPLLPRARDRSGNPFAKQKIVADSPTRSAAEGSLLITPLVHQYDPNRRWLSNIKTTSSAYMSAVLQDIGYSFDRVGNVKGYTNT